MECTHKTGLGLRFEIYLDPSGVSHLQFICTDCGTLVDVDESGTTWLEIPKEAIARAG